MLGADVVVPQGQGLPQRHLQHLLGPRREGYLPLRLAVALAHDAGDFGPHFVQRHVQRAKHPGSDAIAFAQQAEQHVLGTYVVVS